MSIHKISNYVTYNKGMASSIQDKCWWIQFIPSHVDTIIDYGCATGELFVYIQNHYPNRFKNFIGVDNDDTMLKLAKSRNIAGAKFYKYLELVKVDGKNTILILNSVIHEILTYNGTRCFNQILNCARNKGVYAVAIRDMFYSGGFNAESATQEFLSRTNKPSSWYEHQLHCHWANKSKMLQEYLLKYRYIENWDREVREHYLWDWDRMVKRALNGYSVSQDFTFSIPQQKENIKRELAITWEADTHKKMLMIMR